MAWWAWLAKLGKGVAAGAKTGAAGSKVAAGLQSAVKTGVQTASAGSKIAAGLQSAGETGASTAGTSSGASKGLGAMLAAGAEDVAKGKAAGISGEAGGESLFSSGSDNTLMAKARTDLKTQQPTYRPSLGDLGRQVGADMYEQTVGKYAGPVRMVGDISGNRSITDFANRATDTTGFRSGGKLSYQPEEMSREKAMQRGLKDMSQMAQQQGQSDIAQQRQREEEFERNRREELRQYYPNLF